MKRILSKSTRAKLSAAGKRGGLKTTAKKAAAAARNGSMPPGPGKRRGWPKGKPRKPLPPQ